MNKDISVIAVFSNAWKLVKGSKGPIWNVAILILLIAATLEWASNRMIDINLQHTHYFIRYITLPILTNILIAPFYAGAIMVAIHHTRGETINIKSGFQYFHRLIPILITVVIIGLVSSLLTMIINIPQIAYSLGKALPYFDLIALIFKLFVYSIFVLSVPMVIDKNYSPGEALATSVLIVKPHCLRVFAIFFTAYLCLFIILTPTFLGLILNNDTLMIIGSVINVFLLIWLLPFAFLLIGDIYHRLVAD